ncbi:hypothetical protein [Streptomyces sp. N35]|uniref:hypothetical protein n=1 Tax=Streptomyces sp. N35 TaxID=2795730 RepID=UPI0018F47118|nr:hypothetical protein [Streptomyces sp. N35]
MSLFNRRPKFSDMPTPEEEYLRSQQRRQEFDNAARRKEAARQRATKWQAEEQRAASKPRIKKVGTLRKVGRNKWQTDGWEIDVPTGKPGRVVERNVQHRGSLHGLTIQDLCRAAHGPRCNCTRR